jgi:hypothetical protein
LPKAFPVATVGKGKLPGRSPIVNIPSHNLVIVRLGYTQDPEAWDMSELIGDVLEAVAKQD